MTLPAASYFTNPDRTNGEAKQGQDDILDFLLNLNAGVPSAAATGTVGAITATFSPAITLADKTLVSLVCSGANTSTTPTFAPNGLTAHTITKQGGQALVNGDIPRAGFVALLQYDSANNRWELLNPKAMSPAVATTYTAQHTPTVYALTSASTITFDNTLTAYASLTLGHNATLGDPANKENGQAGEIVVTGASTYTLGVHANWKMADGTAVALAPAAGKKTWIWWECNGTYNYITSVKQEA
jgi:hypothetical protein